MSELETVILSMRAETHVHPGVGQSTGALDLPVARERVTQYPFIPGSGVKGAFRVWASERAGLDKDEVAHLFGSEGLLNAKKAEDSGGDMFAGGLLCSDARLLLLPVRCLSDSYKWVTCPDILNRFLRDLERGGAAAPFSSVRAVPDGQYRAKEVTDPDLGLEEREFTPCDQALDPKLLETLSAFVEGTGQGGRDALTHRLVVLSDRDFIWFARFALPVSARNALDAVTKSSGALWYEETLAPDSLFYLILGERKAGAVKQVVAKVTADGASARYIQMGGNETIGQGWFHLACFPPKEGPHGT